MAKKTPVKKVKETPKQYKVTALINGETFVKETDDIKETLLSLKPDMVYSELEVKVEKGGISTDRHLNLRQSRNLFINDSFMDVFISNLMLE